MATAKVKALLPVPVCEAIDMPELQLGHSKSVQLLAPNFVWPDANPTVSCGSALKAMSISSTSFVSDTLETGRRFCVFIDEDQYTRRGLGVEIDTSLPGTRTLRVLDRLVALWGKPARIVSGNGTEPTCNAMLKWTTQSGID